MKQHALGSEGTFTTQKLQALLDSRRNPAVASRTALAEAMGAAGQSISVHGIDAWFKTNDSNYGFERPSLDPKRRSFPLPKRRWSVLLELFDLTEEDLAPADADFRRWCFREVREREERARSAAARHRLLVLRADAEAEALAPILRVLRSAGHAADAFVADGADPQADLVRRVRDVHAVLAWCGDASRADPFVRAGLEEAARAGIPRAGIRDAPGTPAPDAVPDLPMLDPSPAPLRRGVRDLLAPLDPEAVERGPTWARPEPVTDRASIAVLPFLDLTGDDRAGWLADGLTEDVTTLLSRIPEFFVIAHSTMKLYRSTPDLESLRRQLGVRYLVQASLRADGRRVRVTTELIDAGSGVSLWSRRLERPLEDLFSVQDEITVEICAQIEPRLRVDHITALANSGTLSARLLWQEGWHRLFVDAPQPVPERSLECFRQAIDMQPDYGLAHAGLAIALSTGLLWGGLPPKSAVEARHHAETAMKLLPENPVALYAMGMITFFEPESLCVPLEYLEKAVELEPSNAMYQGVYGYLLANLGRAEDGVERCLAAMRLSPRDSREPFLTYMLGAAYIANAQYELAIETMTRCRRFSEVDFIWVMIAFAHHQLGEDDRAITALKSIERPRPYRFYRYALTESLWMELPRADKDAFLPLFAVAGLD